MPGYAEYFEANRPKPVWFIGDRVFGKWNKIPFVGTVGNDNMVSELEGPRVSVHLDLPIKFSDKVYTLIFVKQKEIKKLVPIEDAELPITAKSKRTKNK